MAIRASGINRIDSLVDSYTWTNAPNEAFAIKYAFTTQAGFQVPDALKSAYLSAAQEWSNVANIRFVASGSSTAQITYGQKDLSAYGQGVIGTSFQYGYSNGKLARADVVLDDRFATSASVAKGTLGYLTLIHEIGHSIGLKHPGDYNGESGHGTGVFLPTAEDTLNASVMSYNSSAIVNQASSPPITPQLYDIAAVQYMYGANTTYNSGNTTYSISGAKNAQTIWDGGGNDTINASKIATASTIDLNEGLNSYSKIGSSYVWAAFGANIENATGGSAGDTINGNSLHNILIGNEGNDSIFGNIGNDSLFGDAGNDMLNGGVGNDFLFGGLGNDTLVGGAGSDTFYFTGGSGKDTVLQFEGAGVIGGDVIRLASLNLNPGGISSISKLLEAVSYSATGAVIKLGGANDITLVGVTNHLQLNDFQIG